MKYSEAGQGRAFVIRLEHGEVVHEVIERFAAEQSIVAASLIILGGADSGSRLIVGPEDGEADEISPMRHAIDGVHEITGAGTLFPDEEGNPSLHMHIAGGREGGATAGCIRSGVKVWKVMEVIIHELTGSDAARRFDPDTGFRLLEP